MIYRSNLVCPDLTPHFKHLHSRVMGHSFGHDVLSDWADKADDDPVFGIYKNCGFWTHDEAAILYNVARRAGVEGPYDSRLGSWLDIGTHTGWTAAHISAATLTGVDCIDPMIANKEFRDRFNANVWKVAGCVGVGETSAEFFSGWNFIKHDEWEPPIYAGVVIDGDHEPGVPLADAKGAAAHLADTGVIVFHDFIGQPVREAVTWLMDQGFHCRVYLTPHMVALCWRGDFTPPDHVPDPFIVAQDLVARCPDFDWSRVE